MRDVKEILDTVQIDLCDLKVKDIKNIDFCKEKDESIKLKDTKGSSPEKKSSN
jgi:hypothetical protein